MSLLISVVAESDLPSTHKSKKGLAKELDVHFQTIANWHKLARATLPDYRQFCYCNGKALRGVPLNPYQCWILSQIAELYPQLNHHALLAQEFRINAEQYSFAYFTTLNQQTA